MTTVALPSSEHAVVSTPPPSRETEAFWNAHPYTLLLENRTYPLYLLNFAGRNYPALSDDMMVKLLDIQPWEKVVDIGGGDAPFSRADVVTDAFPENSAHRSGRGLDAHGKQFVHCFAESLPFADHEFDVAYSRAVLEHTVDPAAACREMMRVAKRGYLEAPSPIAEVLGGHPTHRWLVWVERLPGEEPTLVFRRRPFRRAPLRYALRGLWFQDADFRFRWEWQYRNVICTQMEWEGSFRFRVEEGFPEAFDYDDPAQAAESHLDVALCGLRFGDVPADVILPDIRMALQLQPAWAAAHNALGCILWKESRFEEALQAFREARRLEPTHTSYARNAALRPSDAGHTGPMLVTLPEPEGLLDWNFAGKVYHAFVDFDDWLARDLNIQPGERVLDVGGGQRPLKRADVSIDLDVEEGLHRQGQIISREKPLVCGNVEALPFGSKVFDVVCCRMVLEHVIDPAAACHELQRVAKRGFLETPNLMWECFYGHPTHRWLVEWEEPTRTLIFRRKPFDAIPFRSLMLPLLLKNGDLQAAFEVNYRNVTSCQVTWDEAHPFSVRVEDDENSPLDYLGNPEHAVHANLNYARDLQPFGVMSVPEVEEAIRLAPTDALRKEALRLRLNLALTVGDTAKANEVRDQLTGKQAVVQSPQAANAGGPSAPSGFPSLKSGLFWQAPLRDPSGYADEARHFLFALDSVGIEVSARELRWSDKLATLSPERQRTLSRLLNRPAPPNAISVMHILASVFQRDPGAKANIGRTMFETDRLPEGWVQACNQMDFVWIPGEFNKGTFAFAGVKPEKLRMIPGAIDLTPYNPHCAPLQIDGARGFNFLSVFDWTLRKGWDVMLQAYVETFRPDEDVALIIKTHSSLGYTTEQMGGKITDFLTQTLRLDLNRIPDIVLQDSNVPDARMPNLYRAADCYVMPTRGEGWGRPYMEAMAMGLPTIATGWSGQTAFMNRENSHVLDFELVDVPEVAWRETPTYRGHRWAEPSLPHLKQLMRQVFEDRAAGTELGQRARAHLEQQFTYTPVARIIAAELAKLD